MVDRHRFVHLHHDGINAPNDANKMAVTVRQIHRVHLKLLRFFRDSHHQLPVVQLARQRRAVEGGIRRTEGVRAEVKDEAVFLPGSNEHGNVDARAVGFRIGDVDDGDAVVDLLAAEGGAGVVVLTRRSQKRPVAVTLEGVPQIRADAVVLARVANARLVALVHPLASRQRVDLLDASVVAYKIRFGDSHVVDDDVLHAADETGLVVGQDLLSFDDASQIRPLEHRVALARRADGMRGLEPVVDAQRQVAGVDGDVDLLPIGVVEVVSYHNAFVFADEVAVQVQFSVMHAQAEMRDAFADGHHARPQRRLELHVQLVALVAAGRHFDVRVSGQRDGGAALTPLAVEPGRASAVGPVVGLADQPRDAGAVVEAVDVVTSGQSHAAVLAPVTSVALAGVIGNVVDAKAVLARLEHLALVDLHVAIEACVSGFALALVLGDAVDAFALEAGIGSALIDVDAAIGSCEKKKNGFKKPWTESGRRKMPLQSNASPL